MQRLAIMCAAILAVCVTGARADLTVAGTIDAGGAVRTSPSYVLVDSLGDMSGDMSSSPNWQFAAGDLYPDFQVPQIASQRMDPNYQIVQVYSAVVTAGVEDFNNTFYVEDLDALGGIRVDRGFLTSVTASRGDWVDLQGPLFTSTSGERYLRLQSLTTRFAGEPMPNIWSIRNASLGGGPAGSVPGVFGSYGINNVGLLVRTWGRVTYVDPSGAFFYIDDGSPINDGSGLPGATGVRVLLSGLAVGNAIPAPQAGEYLLVRGISSTQNIYGHIVRALRPRDASDIQDIQ